jgi:antirestriction protein ArdC
MRHDNQQPAGGQSRANLYQEVTDRVIAELEKGCVPWVRPWDQSKSGLAMPQNATTGRHYSGINVLILWDAVISRDFGAHRWLTLRQANAIGGHVRKGERGITVCYADRFIPKAEQQRAAEQGDSPNAVPFLKRFTVFNVEQCDGIPEAVTAAPALEPCQIVEQAERLITATDADFRNGGGEAFYHRGGDYIRVPPQPAFFDQINYYRTCFHELGHWTGHGKRLARDLTGRFGSEGYAREELVAEMTSAFVCAQLSIQPTVRHADYIGNWLTVLRSDARAIFQAASMASKAADFILAFTDQAARAA